MLLAVEYNENAVLKGHFVREGAELLVKRIHGRLRQRAPEHDHSATPSWAGWKLTEKEPSPRAKPVNTLNPRFWPHERQDKTGGTR